MKKVLVLGAGRIAGPCIQYLLAQDGYEVYVSDIDEANVRRCIGGKSNGHARIGNVMETLPDTLRNISPDVVVCLLPAAFMASAAKACADARVDYVNPSYIKPEIKALDADAKKNGVTLLCELGLDPGIDHMSASKTIDQIHAQGGRVMSFKSWCGALPAPKDNNNPVGYKISWAPASLIGASKREARTVKDGKIIVRPNGETYRYPGLIEIEGLGWFEEYANADSTPYIEKYGIPERPEDLASHNCLHYTHAEELGRWRFNGPDGAISVPVRGSLHVNDDEALSQAVIGGLGIGILPTFIIGRELQNGTLMGVLSDCIPVESHVYAMYLPTRHLPAKIRVFIDHFLALIGDEPYWDRGLDAPRPPAAPAR